LDLETPGPSDDGGLDELVELIDREAIFLSKMRTKGFYPGMQLQECLDDGLPDIHESSQHIDLNEQARFSKSWTFQLSDNGFDVQYKKEPDITGCGERTTAISHTQDDPCEML
jgi:hypothetical protein